MMRPGWHCVRRYQAVTLGTRPHVPTARLLAVAVSLVVLLAASPARAEPFGWAQPGGPGTPVALTFSFLGSFLQNFQGIPEHELRAATTDAFATWSQHVPLHFVERPDSGPPASDVEYSPLGQPDIRIGAHGLGGGLILAHAFVPVATAMSGLAGDIHFNSDSTLDWGIGTGYPAIDFREVMLHEIGHTLGLHHLEDPNSIMHPVHGFFLGNAGRTFLLPADIAAIQGIYGAGVGSVSPVPEPATLILVGAGLAGAFVRRVRARGVNRAHRCAAAVTPPDRTAR
jgi:hypothetical protein